MWKDRTCTGCHQACRYGAQTDLGATITWREASHIRYLESKEAAKRGEYGPGVRRTRGRVLGLMHQQKREGWAELIHYCPERLYPPPGADGPLDYDAADPDAAAELAAAQSALMDHPIARKDLEAQLAQEYTSDPEEWEHMLAQEYRAELAYRKKHGRPRALPQPEPIAEVQAGVELMPWDEGFTGGAW